MTSQGAGSTHHPDPTNPCPASLCLTGEDVVGFLEGSTPEINCRVSAHIASCQSCQEFVKTVSGILVKEGEVLDEPDEGLIRRMLEKLPNRQLH